MPVRQDKGWQKAIRAGGKFANAARRRGVSHALDMVGAHVLIKERRAFETRYRLDTEEPVLLDDLTIKGNRRREGFYYGATPPRVIHALLANLPTIDGFTFVDFGSGKGIVLFVAAEYRFESVIGVEFAVELHETALQNIERFAGQSEQQRCGSIQSICADAAEFPIPSENCALYFCNPFTDELMQDVVNNIGESFARCNQKIYILFHQLVEEEAVSMAYPIPIFESASFLVERPFKYRSYYEQFLLRHLRLKIYETIPTTDR